MSRADSKAHLAKAGEFLDAARVNLAHGWTNAATSNAVSCGINAKDAICLTLTGRSLASERHADATRELARSGSVGAELETTFGRLLRLKPKAQYQRGDVSITDAAKVVEWAQRMYDAARRLATS